jgi:hypothetical protein
MRRNDDYLVWYCGWCDSKNLIPRLLQHESNRFCPASARQAVLMYNAFPGAVLTL